MLVEGLPGAGLVGKIAADHLVAELDTTYYAALYCDGLSPVATYRGEDSTLRPPVRLYAAESEGLLVLQSDVPVSPSSAPEFATCLTDWLTEEGILPIYLSGLGRQKRVRRTSIGLLPLTGSRSWRRPASSRLPTAD